MALDLVWSRRRDRADALRAEHPPAAELLAFYGDLVALQVASYAEVLHSAWPVVDPDTTRIHFERLPERQTGWVFDKFIRALPQPATPILTAIAGRLAGDRNARHDLLVAFVARHPLDAVARTLDCDPTPLEFFPRAFLQPYAEALLVRASVTRLPSSPVAPAVCPHCRSRPVAGVLRDEPDVKGRRTLLCCLCSAEWGFPRARCPACGEEAADRLQSHIAEAWPHVRVEECASCSTYIKTVDLRENGHAIPVVDELASVELDLWAAGRHLVKYQPNLLGL